MEDGLYKVAQALETEFPGKSYNTLFFIQSEQWKESIPLLKSDLKVVKDALFKIRTNRRLLPDHLVTKWVEDFRLLGRLARPRTLGLVVKLRDTPSVLAATRL